MQRQSTLPPLSKLPARALASFAIYSQPQVVSPLTFQAMRAGQAPMVLIKMVERGETVRMLEMFGSVSNPFQGKILS
ncbi:hypothetical protein BDV41DRAFT_537561 [Aspergillus transmontanensis]|uniref:Uncharacterized protein n=1 Tax=Aspergillus transmontanensis TaxID=1034304 RepID=A0A5N6W146_9EURO|nr:hypothetical protein BDV41DRAFT_537561 [Aspergillus transmontanensis]